jgi:hypothetical protein
MQKRGRCAHRQDQLQQPPLAGFSPAGFWPGPARPGAAWWACHTVGGQRNVSVSTRRVRVSCRVCTHANGAFGLLGGNDALLDFVQDDLCRLQKHLHPHIKRKEEEKVT